MAPRRPSSPFLGLASVLVALLLTLTSSAAQAPTPAAPAPSPAVAAPATAQAPPRVGAPGGEVLSAQPPDFNQMRRDQAATDRAWHTALDATAKVEKILYRSRVGDLDIPAFVFQPLAPAGAKTHPAIVWVHENIRGHLYEHYIPFVRDAVAKGYVVIAPEYRGSIGYGKKFYDAIDYGGAEVDDVVTAAGVLSAKYPQVDPARIGIIGWSHGGLISLLAVMRNPTTFKSAAAIVPVTNLFQRIAWKGDRQRVLMDPHNRFGGTPSEHPEAYRDRSPLFQVDKLQIPLLVHMAENDEDVNIEEGMQLIDALRARKPTLADTKIYKAPAGGHTFDRLVTPKSWQPENTPEQRDSWSRVWAFFGRTLDGAHEASGTALAVPRK
jgi:dipeptidyl aminopeptidase/acylaminoacyl peptidase